MYLFLLTEANGRTGFKIWKDSTKTKISTYRTTLTRSQKRMYANKLTFEPPQAGGSLTTSYITHYCILQSRTNISIGDII